MENEVDFCGIDLVLWGIFLGWKCRFVDVLYFLKHNNKISLSLVLGFPILGFSLEFASECYWVVVHCVFPLHILLNNVYFCLWKFTNVGFCIYEIYEDNYL
jgi:hypothetical protein